MSDPTSGGSDKPGPGPERDAERDLEEVQDQPTEPVHDDPTAPVWSDPTAPLPSEPPAPTPPGAPRPPGDEQSGPRSTPPVAPALTNPYAQQQPPQGQQPASPYGQQQPPAPYGQQQSGPLYPAYGQQQPPAPYGQQQSGPVYPAYGQQTYATGTQTETNGSAIVLTVLSGISFLFGNILAIGSLILGIIALNKNSTDHEGSRGLTKIGWIVFAVTWAVAVLAGIVLIIIFAALLSGSGSSTSFGN